MIYKTLHIHKNTNNDYTTNTLQTHIHKNTNNDLQNTTHTQQHNE